MSMIAKDSKMRWTGEILHHRRCQDQKEENFDLDLFRERQICGFTSAEEEKRPRSRIALCSQVVCQPPFFQSTASC